MVSFPHCKINLGLHVTRKRADGFHDIETCFYPVPWWDVLEVIPSQTFQFVSTGISIPGDPENNLCIRAFKLLSKDFNLSPIKVHLHKVIPMGAGLGGGSSDAAFMLFLLNEIFELGLNKERLKDYARQLGSDCAFFVDNKPMIGTGRGDVLTPVQITLKEKYMVIVKPDIHVSTPEAYAQLQPREPESALENLLQLPVDQWRNGLVNDFESTVFGRYPEIKAIKEKLYRSGAWYASMTGSGSGVFGLFDVAIDLKKEFPSCTYWSGTLTI